MCIASMKSMTAALKGKAALEASLIDCEIVSLDPALTEKGCAYGVSFPSARRFEAERILKAKKIPYGKILGGLL